MVLGWITAMAVLAGVQGWGWAEDLPKVEGVHLSGYTAIEENVVRELLDLEAGAPFSPARLEAGIERVLTFYENHGYPFAAVRIDQIALTPRRGVALDLDVEEGPHVAIGAIRVQGNMVTREEVILRELRVRPGDLYDQRRIVRGMRYVEQLEFIERVDPPEIQYNPHGRTATVVVPIQEGQTSQINAVVGYAPGIGMEKGYFTGLVDLALGNLFGTGRSIATRWERRAPEVSKLFVAYREPWAFGFPVNLGGRFGQQQRRGYMVTVASVGVDLPVSERWRGTVEMGWESTIPDSVGRLSIPKSRTWVGGLSLVYDTRDELTNPRRGLLYRSLAEIGFGGSSIPDRKWTPQNRVNRRRYELDLEQFLPLGRRQAVALGFHGAAVQSDEPELPVSEKLYLGGARSLRGYREEQFPASRMVWMNLELRHGLGRRSRAFLFLDGGYYADRRGSSGSNTTRTVEDIKWGYGCGVRLEARAGIIGIDYGLGEGDGLLDGKIHVGIVNSW